MTPSIFDFENYQDYLSAYLSQLPKRGHGFRSKMAEAMRCEGSYVSRILNGQAFLQLEQAEALSRLLEQSSEEFDYFAMLVQHARAGTQTLRDYFRKRMSLLVENRLKIRNRVPSALPLSEGQQARYFSHWQFAAVHMLLLIPEMQTRESLFHHLKIPPNRLGVILDFLCEAGLVVYEAGKYKVGPTVIQLPGDSPLIIQSHLNLRRRAVQAIEDEPDKGLHYSCLMTMSKEDARKARELYINSIEKMNRAVDQSENETSVALVLDFFEI